MCDCTSVLVKTDLLIMYFEHFLVIGAVVDSLQSSLWKTFTYTRHDLYKTYQDSVSDLDQILLEYECNKSQLSCLTELQCDNNQVASSLKLCPVGEIKQTVVDHLYQEVFIESQCLLANSEERTLSRRSVTRKYDLAEISETDKGHCFRKTEPVHETFASEKIGKYKRKHKLLTGGSVNSGTNRDYVDVIEETPVEEMTYENMSKVVKVDELFSSASVGSPVNSNDSSDPGRSAKISTLPLSDAVKDKHDTNVLVVLLQCNPSKQVQIKKGINAGQFIKLASIMVGDSSMFYFNITLWNEASDWVDRFYIGDVILITNLLTQLYRGSVVGQTNTTSQVYNFHRPTSPYPASCK